METHQEVHEMNWHKRFHWFLSCYHDSYLREKKEGRHGRFGKVICSYRIEECCICQDRRTDMSDYGLTSVEYINEG